MNDWLSKHLTGALRPLYLDNHVALFQGDMRKAIDKAAGASRKTITSKRTVRAPGGWADMKNSGLFKPGAAEFKITAPATADAKAWQGWGTALKPAHESITVARKPLGGTVANNVLVHGTGALHIDACRVGAGELRHVNAHKASGEGCHLAGLGIKAAYSTDQGRFPANFIHDGSAEVLAGFAATGKGTEASRFFYVAKPGQRERIGNDHPTVKPLALMRYLIRLTCAPGSVVVDPFGGSGTTGLAARAEGVRCILIEQDRYNCRTIIRRLKSQAMAAV